MAGLKALDNFEIFDVAGFLKGKELVMVSCEKNYNKMKDENGNKVPDPTSPRGLKFEINIDKDILEYEVFDFNTKKRKKQKGVNFRKSFILFIDNPDLEPEKFDDFSIGEKVMIKGLKPTETMHFGSNLIVVADDLVKLERKQPQQ
jgi:hypothetical protein